MYQALFLNTLIIAVILFGIAMTGNPLFILGLLMLQNMPFVPPGLYMDDDDDLEQPMGFTANVK